MIFIIIVRILDQLLDISDNMLDYVINVCEDFDVVKNKPEVSLEITTWETETVEEIAKENFTANFNVYAPEECCDDIENFQFGIMSSLDNWTQMTELQASK